MPRTAPPLGQRRRRDQNFNQNDLARVLRAARAAKLSDYRVEVDTSRKTITIITGAPEDEDVVLPDTPENIVDKL